MPTKNPSKTTENIRELRRRINRIEEEGEDEEDKIRDVDQKTIKNREKIDDVREKVIETRTEIEGKVENLRRDITKFEEGGNRELPSKVRYQLSEIDDMKKSIRKLEKNIGKNKDTKTNTGHVQEPNIDEIRDELEQIADRNVEQRLEDLKDGADNLDSREDIEELGEKIDNLSEHVISNQEKIHELRRRMELQYSSNKSKDSDEITIIS